MGSSRLVVALALGLALASIHTPTARSQEGEPATAADEPSPDPADPSPEGTPEGEGAATTPAGAADPAPASPTSEDDVAGDAALPTAAPLPDAQDAAARELWLVERLQSLTGARPQLGAAKVGVAIVDVTSGRTLFAANPDAPLNLASNTKVLTAAAALARLGPDFRWRTAAFAEKWDPVTGTVEGDLYVRGKGDPTLRARDLRALAHDLHMAGVRSIEGKVIFDVSYFDRVDEPPHFAEQPKERAGFRAPIGALAIEGNAITVVIEPDPAGVAPATVTIEPDVGDYVTLQLAEVSTTTTGRSRLSVASIVKKDKIELSVRGQLRHDHGPDWIRRRIDDPLRMISEVLRAALDAEGIRVAKGSKKKVVTGVVPEKATLLAWHDSAPLAEIVREMNKQSNNYYAEVVLKTLGAEVRARAAAPGAPPAPASWQDGLDEVRRWMVEDAGITGDPRVGNGSGLFGSTAVSALQLARALDAAWRDFRVGPDLAASLAVMGVDGTVRSRMRGTPAQGRVRAKTGTLAAVSTLAGYAAVDGRRPLAFAILVNDIPAGARGHARALQNDLLAACLEFLGGT